MVDDGDGAALGATGETADELDAEGVQDFYTDYLQSSMVSYRLKGNKRLDAVMKRLKPIVRRDTIALDIGCGIGLISEFIAKRAVDGHVVGCDLSRANLSYARRTTGPANVEFHNLDFAVDHAKIRERLGDRRADLIVLVDVIEHIPSPKHQETFKALSELLADDGVLFLSFPSKAYQRWLRENEPEGLQPVDEEIELEDLMREASNANLSVRLWDPIDLWAERQYVHAFLEHRPSYATPVERRPPRSDMGTKLDATLKLLRRIPLMPWRYYRYLWKPFRGAQEPPPKD